MRGWRAGQRGWVRRGGEGAARGTETGGEGVELHPGQLALCLLHLAPGFQITKHSSSLDSSFATKVKIISLSVLFFFLQKT